MSAVFAVENLDQPHHQTGYKLGGMDYFMRVVEMCSALAFMRFPNGAIGAGVAKEILAAQLVGIPIYDVSSSELVPNDAPRPILSVEETRAMIASLRAESVRRISQTSDDSHANAA